MKTKGYWSKENCIKEALKYKTSKAFRKSCEGGYAACRKNGWLEEINSFLTKTHKPKGFWTYENCKNESLKYTSKVNFYKNCSSAYNISRKNGWLEEICNHMNIVGDLFNRCIYAIEFSDNHVYVGLTHNLEKRFEEHMIDGNWNKSSVLNYSKKSGLIPIIKQLSEYINVNEASKLEEVKKEEYIKNNWIILNKVKCGSIGNNSIKWNKDKCHDEALKYKTIKEFSSKNKSAYMACLEKKWIDELCLHMMKYNFKTKKYE